MHATGVAFAQEPLSYVKTKALQWLDETGLRESIA
jgi:hypothetical protein